MARQDHKSEAEVIRELLETGFETQEEQQTVNFGQSLRGLAKLGQEVGITGPTDLQDIGTGARKGHQGFQPARSLLQPIGELNRLRIQRIAVTTPD